MDAYAEAVEMGSFLMVQMTYSLQVWLLRNYPETFVLVSFGHTYEFTEQMQQEYLAWCCTDEGKRYLVGGDKYEEHKRRKGETA